MKNLQELFIDAGVSELKASDLTTFKVKDLPDSNTGDVWGIGVVYNGQEYGGTVIVPENKKEHMENVYAGVEDFAATIADTVPVSIA